VAYARASDGDKQETSVPDQRDWISRVAPAERLELVKVFEDDGVVGDDLRRPGLNEMLAFVDAEFFADRQIDVLVCWDTDRMSRSSSLRNSAFLARLFESGVTRVLCKDGWLNLEDAIQLLLLNVKQDFGNMGYVKSVSGNVLRTVLKKAKQGRRTGGRVPLGYRPGEADTLILGPDAEVELVRTIFRWYVIEDVSTGGIARRLLERGVPPPKRGKIWRPNAVRAILKNRAYLGEFRWFDKRTGKYSFVENGEVRLSKDLEERRRRQRRKDLKGLPVRKGGADEIVIPGVYPGIIDPETFDAAQKRLSRNGLRRRAAGPDRWPLAGLLVCGCCGDPAWCIPARRRVVMCGRKKTLGPAGCSGGGRVEYEEVLRRVVEVLAKNLGGEKARGSLRARMERLAARREKDLGRLLKSARADAARLNDDVARATRRILIIDEAHLAGAQAALEAMKHEQAEAAKKASSVRVDAVAKGDVGTVVLADDADGVFEQVFRLRLRQGGVVVFGQGVGVGLADDEGEAVGRVDVRAAAFRGWTVGHGDGCSVAGWYP
jgi:DNA invertase Pin-like site-specific DNA recombinase